MWQARLRRHWGGIDLGSSVWITTLQTNWAIPKDSRGEVPIGLTVSFIPLLTSLLKVLRIFKILLFCSITPSLILHAHDVYSIMLLDVFYSFFCLTNSQEKSQEINAKRSQRVTCFHAENRVLNWSRKWYLALSVRLSKSWMVVGTKVRHDHLQS